LKLRTALLLLVLISVTLFTVLNWSAFNTPTRLTLIVTTVDAPLGVIMLFLTAVIVVAFLAFVVYLQASTAREARRLARELQSQRELADRAEASRFTELRSFVAQELTALRAFNADAEAKLVSRIDAVEQALRTDIEHAGNTLAAYIGELGHRLDSSATDHAEGDRP
jgi:ABC-type multidrug transport system fused ATPase/permease subunit